MGPLSSPVRRDTTTHRVRPSRGMPAINSLNEKYGGGFCLFFRAPAFSQRDERYMGWERKRGALTELVRLAVEP